MADAQLERNRALVREFIASLQPYRDIDRADTGKLSATGAVNHDVDEGLPTGYVWARKNGQRHEAAYKNAAGVRLDMGNVAVFVGINNLTQEAEVFALDQATNFSRYGQASYMLYEEGPGDLSRQIIPLRNIKEARPHLWITGTLKVNVGDFWYVNTDGDLKWWTAPAENEDNGTCLDLAASVPAASGSISRYVWAAVDFDTDATAPGLVATPTTARALSNNAQLIASVDKTFIEAIPLAANHRRLGFVALASGDADETTVTEARWLRPDPRFATLGSNSTGGSLNADSILLNAYGEILTNGTNVLTNG
jgi:hypothetical protein